MLSPKPVGNYDEQCEKVGREINADCVALLVVNGNKGNGFSVGLTDPKMIDRIPMLLREMADGIEEELKCRKQNESGSSSNETEAFPG